MAAACGPFPDSRGACALEMPRVPAETRRTAVQRLQATQETAQRENGSSSGGASGGDSRPSLLAAGML